MVALFSHFSDILRLPSVRASAIALLMASHRATFCYAGGCPNLFRRPYSPEGKGLEWSQCKDLTRSIHWERILACHTVLLRVVFAATLCLSILAVRCDHPDHVHTLWHIVSVGLKASHVKLSTLRLMPLGPAPSH
jgi:hypothetical protein